MVVFDEEVFEGDLIKSFLVEEVEVGQVAFCVLDENKLSGYSYLLIFLGFVDILDC